MSPLRNNGDKAARQEAIRRIVRAQHVSTQEELGQLLSREGYDVTQATLSRDLAQLGAMRVSLPEGGTVYGLEPPPRAGEARLMERPESARNVCAAHVHMAHLSARLIAHRTQPVARAFRIARRVLSISV